MKVMSGSFALGIFMLCATISPINAKNYVTNIEITKSEKLPKPQYQNALGTFLVDLTNSNVSVTELSNQLNNYFELDQQHQFELIKEQRDAETGFVHYSYQHFYNNIKVHGDIVFLHVKEGKVQFINGQLVSFKELSTTGTINEEKVRSIAYANFGLSENVKESLIETYILKQEIQESALKLTFINKINLTALNPLKSIDFIIDAQSGEIITQRNKIYNADTPSTSATYYRGSKDITVDSYNGGYRLRDNARNIRTFKGSQLNGGLNNDGTFTGYTDYSNSTANFTSANNKPAVEVHWAIKETYDYYKNIHKRNSFDGNGHVINNYYDAGHLMGTSENAGALDESFGNQTLIAMLYGKGGATMNPVVSLDVAGHEYSHLVVSRNGSGGLDYENESGALNESFADMFGTAIEFYVNDAPNWTMGEGVIKNSISPNYLRNMSNPNDAPFSIGAPRQPDTYKGTYWQNTTNNPNGYNDYGGVHINSGVGNFWFYLLSVGGSGVNDINNSYDVAGITIQKAEKIAYKALTSGLTPSATYLDAYNATIQAATILYGANSNEWNQVVNAWYAVGIGNGPASNQNIEMKTKLLVYPNPVSGDEVTIESSLDETISVEMYDMQGKRVMKSMSMTNKTTLNVASYTAGIYLLKFKSDSGEYTHKLIIK